MLSDGAEVLEVVQIGLHRIAAVADIAFRLRDTRTSPTWPRLRLPSGFV
jgi:hypothetical protein